MASRVLFYRDRISSRSPNTLGKGKSAALSPVASLFRQGGCTPVDPRKNIHSSASKSRRRTTRDSYRPWPLLR